MHIRLTNELFEKWAVAMVSNQVFCSCVTLKPFQLNNKEVTLEKPPNHHLFDAADPQKLTEGSDLLKARLKAVKGQAQQAAAPLIVINNNFPENFTGAVHRGPAPAPPAAVTVAAQGLIPANRQAGPKLPIVQFCQTHQLGDEILSWLQDNKYTGTQAFRYMTNQELKDMGFKPGEIVDLKEAVADWSVPLWGVVLGFDLLFASSCAFAFSVHISNCCRCFCTHSITAK